MDSINHIKGYDKVNHLENQSTTPPKHKPFLTISIVLLFALLFASIIATLLIHQSSTQSPDSLALNSPESIRTVCNVTRYPESCFSSISSLNVSAKPDPKFVFKLSLRVAINELRKLTLSLKSTNGVDAGGALSDCASQLEDALSRLNDSVAVVEDEKSPLTEAKINDVQTWISAAMTDQETCEDGLGEMGSTVVDEVKDMMEKSKEFVSNSLAIIANIRTLLQKFHLTMH